MATTECGVCHKQFDWIELDRHMMEKHPKQYFGGSE